MLYDNALLVPVYLHAWQLTGEHRYRRIAEETLDYVLREMTDPEGGFYSTQDADSDGEEGLFYLWTPEQLAEALGEEDAAVMQEVWGVRPGGNFEGRSILHFPRPEVETANALSMSPTELRTRIERARRILYQVRAERNWPGRDDKVLTAWNGLMLRAMAEAGRILDREDYRRAALTNADFLLKHLVVEGRLRRAWRRGAATVDAYLEDYAALTNGLISTYETTGEARFLTEARRFADQLLDLFFDESTSSFFDTSRDHEALVGRPRELTDNATPAVPAWRRKLSCGSRRSSARRVTGSMPPVCWCPWHRLWPISHPLTPLSLSAGRSHWSLAGNCPDSRAGGSRRPIAPAYPGGSLFAAGRAGYGRFHRRGESNGSSASAR